MHEILDVFDLILCIVIDASRSMILQAESKREYEEVSVKESVQTAAFDLPLLFYIFIPKISAGTSISHRTMEELSRLICAVFTFGFVLGHI